MSKIGADPLSFGVCATLYANHRRCCTPPHNVGFRESLWLKLVHKFPFRLASHYVACLWLWVSFDKRRCIKFATSDWKFFSPIITFGREVWNRVDRIPLLKVHVLLNNHDFEVQLIYSNTEMSFEVSRINGRDIIWSHQTSINKVNSKRFVYRNVSFFNCNYRHSEFKVV